MTKDMKETFNLALEVVEELNAATLERHGETCVHIATDGEHSVAIEFRGFTVWDSGEHPAKSADDIYGQIHDELINVKSLADAVLDRCDIQPEK